MKGFHDIKDCLEKEENIEIKGLVEQEHNCMAVQQTSGQCFARKVSEGSYNIFDKWIENGEKRNKYL